MFTLLFISPLTFLPTFSIFSVYRIHIVLSKTRIKNRHKYCKFYKYCIIVFIFTLIIIFSDYGIINSRVRSRCVYPKTETGFTHNKIIKNVL